MYLDSHIYFRQESSWGFWYTCVFELQFVYLLLAEAKYVFASHPYHSDTDEGAKKGQNATSSNPVQQLFSHYTCLRMTHVHFVWDLCFWICREMKFQKSNSLNILPQFQSNLLVTYWRSKNCLRNPILRKPRIVWGHKICIIHYSVSAAKSRSTCSQRSLIIHTLHNVILYLMSNIG